MDSSPISEGVTSGRIEATDDVEGHVSRGRGIEGPDTDDTEGHGVKIKGLVEDDESQTRVST